MDILQETIGTLYKAEKSLASLASDAAKTSLYDSASYLIRLAMEIHQLAVKAKADLNLNPINSQAVETLSETESSVSLPSSVSRPSTRGKLRKSEYPKFAREGEMLVKIGWSPSEKNLYEHKSSKTILFMLANAIGKIGANGKRFTMERVLPLIDPNDSNKIPDYKAYVCVAWLKSLGLLIQHGRQGYSLSTKSQIESLIEKHWIELPSR